MNLMIVNVAHFYPIGGGSSQRIFYLTQKLCKNNNVTVITPYHKKPRMKNLKLKKTIYPGRGKLKFFGYFAWWFQSLFKVLKESKNTDVIFTHNALAAVPCIIAAKLRKKKLIIDITDIFSLYYEKGLFQKLFKKFEFWTYKQGDVVISVSKEMKKVLKQEGIKNKIEIIPDGVDYYKIKKIKSTLRKNKKTIITHTGGIDKRDGVLLLPETAAKVKKDFQFLMIGDGADRKEMEQLIKNYDVKSKFKITGWVSRDKVIKMLKKSDIGIICRSNIKGNHLVPTIKLFEYLANGLPVIAPNLKSIREINPKGDIITFYEADNTEDLAKKTFKLLNNKSKLKKLSKQSKKLGKKYDWKGIIKKLSKVITND